MWPAWLGPLADVIQIGTCVLAVILALRARADVARYLRHRREASSGRPCALVVSLMGKDINGYVAKCLEGQGLSAITRHSCSANYVTPANMDSIMGELLKLKDKMMQDCATTVHLFYMGPNTIAVLIGAILSNWIPVRVYEFSNSEYRYITTLEKTSISGILQQSVIAQGKSMILGGSSAAGEVTAGSSAGDVVE